MERSLFKAGGSYDRGRSSADTVKAATLTASVTLSHAASAALRFLIHLNVFLKPFSSSYATVPPHSGPIYFPIYDISGLISTSLSLDDDLSPSFLLKIERRAIELDPPPFCLTLISWSRTNLSPHMCDTAEVTHRTRYCLSFGSNSARHNQFQLSSIYCQDMRYVGIPFCHLPREHRLSNTVTAWYLMPSSAHPGIA